MIARVLKGAFGRYALASVAALGCDLACFLLLLESGAQPMAASATGYSLGIVVHWLLSTRFVFDGAMDSDGLERVRQKGLFVATAMLGLAITTLLVGWGHSLGADPRIAKAAAIVVSFLATYGARRMTIFRA